MAQLRWLIVVMVVGIIVLSGSCVIKAEALISTIVEFRVGSNNYGVDGRVYTMDTVPFMSEGHVFLPLRYLAEALNCGVGYEGGSVIIGRGPVQLRLTPGKKTMYVWGKPVEMDVAPIVKNGLTYMPARWIAEALGFQVSWDEANQTVLISYQFSIDTNSSIAKALGLDNNPDVEDSERAPDTPGIQVGESLQRKSGEGIITFPNGDKYSGQLREGVPDGKGKYTWANGDEYVGGFKNGLLHGQGVLTWANGDIYIGEFRENKRTGWGTYYWKNGNKYVGEFKDGQFHGRGTIVSATGDIQKGIWENGNLIKVLITYEWSFNGVPYTIEIPCEAETFGKLLAGYRRKPHPRISPLTINVYACDPDDDRIISEIVSMLREIARKDNIRGDKFVEFVVSFVQGFPYISDSVSTPYDEYPRYPIETLLERRGDCEDTAVLTAVLLREMGYGTVLIIIPGQPGHVAVGVLGGEGAYGAYYYYGRKRYFYIETTGSGWPIGAIPNELRNVPAYVVPLP